MMKGQQIENLWQLREASLQKRSCLCQMMNWKRPIPAAVLINMQGLVLLRLFQAGMYLYEKEKAVA